MAILRGGTRIFGQDIRIGLPRDRSLDDVENDPRFKQKPGGNPESTMGRYQAMVNEAEGFSRKARYYVEFYLPKPGGLDLRGIDDTGQVGISNASQESISSFRSNNELNAVQLANARRVQAFCKSISMPDRDVQMKEIKHHGPARKFAYDYKSAPITASFYTDKFLRERSYFELWQQAAFSQVSNNFNFYDNFLMWRSFY